jgi:hypothetical protein
MTTQLFILILLIHFLGDFALQTHEQSMGKSQGKDFSNEQLFYHVGIYSIVWFIACLAILPVWYRAVPFTILTFAFHYTTDYVTSRIGKPYWKKEDFHNGFVIIGFDQILHYIQIYFTFKLLM